LSRGGFGLWLIGLLIGIVGNKALHSKVVLSIGVYLVATGTLLLGAYYSIGNEGKRRWIGAAIAIWTALFAVWLLVPALHRTPLLHFGSGLAWLFGLGVFCFILWRIDRQEKLESRSTAPRKQISPQKH
jgi:undecaprenyl pyrophosphate phosphatase UppP